MPTDPRGLRDDAPLLDAWLRFQETAPTPFTIPGHKQRHDLVPAGVGRRGRATRLCESALGGAGNYGGCPAEGERAERLASRHRFHGDLPG